MIPVNEDDSLIVDINSSKYKDYYNEELIYLRNEKVINEIINKVENIFNVLETPEHKDYEFFKSLCCDFKSLEEKCLEYKKI